MINFFSIEAHDDCCINNNYWSRHVAKLFEVRQGPRILRYVLFLERYPLLRKILLRLIAEHSTCLRINDDAFRHCWPPAEFVLCANRR